MHKGMEKEFKKSAKHAGLCASEKLVVAVSGGVDSVVLLDLIVKNHPADNILVAHLDHGIRKESGRDAKFVAELAKEYGVHFALKKLKLGKVSEEESREKRYAFLRNTAEKFRADYIVLGHHANDQVETVLLKIIRGAGPLSVWGMKELSGKLWRPLLGVTKEEIIAYAKHHKLKNVEDSSNHNLRYSRNRIRQNIVPETLKINSNLLQTVNREIELGHELAEFVRLELKKWQKIVIKKGVLNTVALLKAPIFIQKELVRGWLHENLGRKNIYSKNIQEILTLAGRSGTKKTQIGRFTITKNYGKIKFGDESEDTPDPVKLVAPQVAYGKYLFSQRIVTEKTPKKNNIYLPPSYNKKLSIRGWRPGDKIRTKAGTKKIQDIFTDAKVSKAKRNCWPIVVLGEEIAWIPLLAASQMAIAKNSKKYLKIEVKIEKKRY